MQVINFKGKISDKEWDKFQAKVKEIASSFNLEIVPEDIKNTILVKLSWTGWRGFNGIEEHFTCTPVEWDMIYSELKDKLIDFGEIAGKHSEVDGRLETKDITISHDQSQIKEFTRKFGNYYSNGHSFLSTHLYHLTEEDETAGKAFKKLVKKILE